MKVEIDKIRKLIGVAIKAADSGFVVEPLAELLSLLPKPCPKCAERRSLGVGEKCPDCKPKPCEKCESYTTGECVSKIPCDMDYSAFKPCPTCQAKLCIRCGGREGFWKRKCDGKIIALGKAIQMPDSEVEFISCPDCQAKKRASCLRRLIVIAKVSPDNENYTCSSITIWEAEQICTLLEAQAKQIKEQKEEKKSILEGHFCPWPQGGKLAITCNCVHSDKHREADWATIDRLQAQIKQLEGEKKGLEERIKKLIGHYKKIGFNDTATYIDQALQEKPK